MKKPISLPKLKSKALSLYAELVKLRAFREGNLNCFTCGKPLQLNTSDCQLGHYLPRGAYPGLTFAEDNCRIQCIRCNVWMHGNTIEFRERLIKDIGIDRVERLEQSRHLQVKFSRSDFHYLIDNYVPEIKLLKDF